MQDESVDVNCVNIVELLVERNRVLDECQEQHTVGIRDPVSIQNSGNCSPQTGTIWPSHTALTNMIFYLFTFHMK